MRPASEHAVEELTGWFGSRMDEHAKAVCYESLASWPGSDGLWKPALDGAIYEQSDRWYVDGAVIEWASKIATPDARDRLLPVVRAADAHHAVGFDALRGAVCVTDPASSEAQRTTCVALASQHESDWRQQESDLEAQRQRSAATKRHIPAIIASTVVAGGAVGAAYATRDSDVGRGIAVASGATAGAALGFTVVAISALKGNWVSKNGNELPGAILGGMAVGAALGGVGAYFLTSSPKARAPVTGAALAFPYVLTLSIIFD